MRKARSGSGSNCKPFSFAALIISDVEIENLGTRIFSNSCADIIVRLLEVALVCIICLSIEIFVKTGAMAEISYLLQYIAF